MQRQAALGHRQRVQGHSAGKQKIINPFIPAKTFAPEENGVNRAQSIKHYGEQKTMSVGKPIHGFRLKAVKNGASGKLAPALEELARARIQKSIFIAKRVPPELVRLVEVKSGFDARARSPRARWKWFKSCPPRQMTYD